MSIPRPNLDRSVCCRRLRWRRAFLPAILVSLFLCSLLFGSLRLAAAQSDHTVSIVVVERSWIEATVDGQRQYYGIMTAGSQQSWTGQSIILLIGNAGGVEVTADDAFLGTLGRRGQVVTLRWPADTGRYPALEAPTTASTATATGTPSATATPSPTATATPSPTLSPSPTPTARSTRTLSPTASVTATIAVTATSFPTAEATPSVEITPTVGVTATVEVTPTAEVQAIVHIVQPGDTLGDIAAFYEVDIENLQAANSLDNPDILSVGWMLIIPNPDGSIPEGITPFSTTAPTIAARGTITERMTLHARERGSDSPYDGITWVTYYGRPNVPIMGILGEFDVDELAVRLQQQAEAYDEANGPALDAKPAFHLVYGMATKAVGDGSHLGFMAEEEVMTYISKAKELDYGVILDVQIGALTPAESITPALAFLAHDNVHLAIDPEFAMVHPGQLVPGNPIGYVTAEQVNETQAVVQQYMEENEIDGQRILLVHQFQDSMIVDKDQLDPTYERIALTLSVDGWGGPWGKISKYNALVNETSPFVAFKIFYRWDEPLLSETHALGEEAYPELGYMEITPNLIIYQ